jgi:Glycoside hydrolase family 5 C-terminal domain
MHWDYKSYSNWTWDNPGMFYDHCVSTKLEECLNLDSVRTFARTYPKAVAGESLNFTYNATTLDANLIYKPNPDCKLPTEIFLSEKYLYVNGFNVEINPKEAFPTFVNWNHSR